MTATRTYSRAEAEEIARLATIAVAEVEPGCVVWPSSGIKGAYGPEWSTRFDVVGRRACLLAYLTAIGPDCLTRCDRHALDDIRSACRMVTVADVLLGRGQDCGAPSTNPQP